MDLMEIRRRLLDNHIQTIGGLRVIYDNARYVSDNGRIDAYEYDDRYFISGIYDTGISASKSITFMRNPADVGSNPSMRLFNDLTSVSYDYWSVNGTGERTLTSGGRYILIPILKSNAADMYMYYTYNGQTVWLYKGKNIT